MEKARNVIDFGSARRREFLRRSTLSLAWMAVLAAAGVCGAASAASAPARILVFGDSLSAGYGLAREEAWPSLLAQQLASGSARKPGSPVTGSWEVVNASISGETTHNGLARLKPTLEREHPQVVILELGANDALRGLPIEDMRRNLDSMARLVAEHGARLLVVGVALPPNYGDDFTGRFAQVYRETARAHHAGLVPNLLESLGASRESFQADGLHPVAGAEPKLLKTVWTGLAPLLTGSRKP